MKKNDIQWLEAEFEDATDARFRKAAPQTNDPWWIRLLLWIYMKWLLWGEPRK